MSYYNNTEEQQFNEAKNWFKQNGTPILVAIVIVAGCVFGWQYWKNYQIQSAQQTSAAYQQVMETYQQDPTKNTPLVEKFISENKGSNYAVLAQLEEAKQLAAKGDFAAVKSVLEQALAATQDATLQNIIRLRLAAVELQLQQFDAALAILAQIQDSAWELSKQTLSGDILAAKGDKAAAKTAYEQAKSLASEGEKMLLDIRLNNL